MNTWMWFASWYVVGLLSVYGCYKLWKWDVNEKRNPTPALICMYLLTSFLGYLCLMGLLACILTVLVTPQNKESWLHRPIKYKRPSGNTYKYNGDGEDD